MHLIPIKLRHRLPLQFSLKRQNQAGKKLTTIDKVVSNFTFGEGGQSTKKSLAEVKRRVRVTYGIYKKYGMSKGYWFYRWVYEIVKYLVG